MPKGTSDQDIETLSMALVGFEQKKVEIEEKIRQLKSMLGGSAAASPKKSLPAPKSDATVEPIRKKRTLSAAARKRIATAQKKRWAEHRKNVAEAAS